MNAKQIAQIRGMLGIAPPVPNVMGTGVVTRNTMLGTVAAAAVTANATICEVVDSASAVPRLSASTQWRSYITQARVYLGPTTLTTAEIQAFVQSTLLRFANFDGTTVDYPLTVLAAWASFGLAALPGDIAGYREQVQLDYPIIGRGQREVVQLVADAAFTPAALTARVVLGGLFFDPGSTDADFAPKPQLMVASCKG